MKKKNLIFGIIISSNDYDRYIKINLEIYNKIYSEFGNFYIIDLSNLTISKKKSNIHHHNKSFSSKKIRIFKPKNKIDFFKFFEQKKLIGFNNLGKTFDNLPLYYYLNKIDFTQVYLMNYGHINNAVEIFKDGNLRFSNSIGVLFFFRRKIINYIYRLLTLFSLLPKIDIYFEASNEIYKSTFKKLKSRKKIEKYLPLEINYFRNIYKINSRSFDYSKRFKNIKSKHICFVDSNINNLDVVLREGKISEESKILYYKRLKDLFNNISILFKKDILICLHPKNSDKRFRKIFKKYKIIKYQTPKTIKDSYIILFHDSSAALDAILLKKSLLCIKSKILGNYWNDRIKQYSKKLDLPTIDLDLEYSLQRSWLLKKFSNSKKKYQEYSKNNLQIDGNKMGEEKVIQVLKKYIN